jgi:ribonuclease-3
MSLKQITDERRQQLEKLALELGVVCTNLDLLDQATTHSSYAAEHEEAGDFERLEFFGDAVLKFVVAEHLFTHFADLDEGQLTEICAVLISSRTLQSVGQSLQLERFIQVGRGVPMAASIIARSMEAIFGAVYLDSSFAYVRKLIEEKICSRADELSKDSVKENYKAQLQQWTQARAQGTPAYRVQEVTGPAHDPVFAVVVLIENQEIATGSGRSKKAAEQEAAKAAFAKLQTPGLSATE